MRSYKTEAIVIKRRNVGEADRLLTLYTKDSGKITVRAKGIRRITSRRSSHVELINTCMLTLYRGRSLPILIEAETIEDFSQIKYSLEKVGNAYHMCELMDGLCPENQENESVYLLFQRFLYRLQKDEDIQQTVKEFEVKLLMLLGFLPKEESVQHLNTQIVIETILERKLKAKQFISSL